MKQKLLVCLIGILSCNNYSMSQGFISDTTADLNNDHKQEKILLRTLDDSYLFRLQISDVQITDSFTYESADGFRLIDIDKSDMFKEIAVHCPGLSDDDEYLIFWYDGTNIIKMAQLARWPTFPGNGIVYADNWEGFWTRRDKYELDKSVRIVNLIPQPAYYVGVKATVKTPFMIYREPELNHKVALLGKDSEIELLLFSWGNEDYHDQLYLIKSQTGLLGWARYIEFSEKIEGLPLAD